MSKHDPAEVLRGGRRERLRRMLQKRLGLSPFIAQRFAEIVQRKYRAEQVPPYALVMAWDPDDRIFVVTVPELPGCRTHGDTYEEAAAKAREAIASWVGAAREYGDPLPEPRVERHLRAAGEAAVSEQASA